MKNLKKIIQTATIATVLLGTAKVSYGDGVELKLPCGAATILAGFKFGHICQKGIHKYSVENTYDSVRQLTVQGNFVMKNGSAALEQDDSISVIDFPARKSLEFNVNSSTSSGNVKPSPQPKPKPSRTPAPSPSASGYNLTINPRQVTNFRPKKTISISCKSGTKRIEAFVITPICSSQTPLFFVENTTNSNHTHYDIWVAYKGVRGAFKFQSFRMFQWQYNNVVNQHKLDLSIISNPRTFSSQTYTLVIYYTNYR